jgi:hypothetical protein
MIELKTQTYRQKVEIKPWIADKFKNPIIFYLTHKSDLRSFFVTFVILDFAEKRISYIVSYYPENIKKIENHPQKEIYQIPNFGVNPHCSIQVNSEESFLTFVDQSQYFYHVNPKEGVMKVYAGRDLPCKEKYSLTYFGSTFYKEGNSFYLSAHCLDRADGKKNSLKTYEAKLDLSNMELVYTETPNHFVPHVTRKFGKYLLNSGFQIRRIKNFKTGRLWENVIDYARYVYEDLYKQYCIQNDIPFDLEFFKSKNIIIYFNFQFDPHFEMFCRNFGKNIFEICENNIEYKFDILPGEIELVDLESNTGRSFETSVCTPAHFEIDEKENFIYASAHNFALFDRYFFMGPAAIDKFKLSDGALIKFGSFSHPTGYRFVSHKIFTFKEKKYICTIGQPNRLFFADAETMDLLFFDDIGEDLLSDQSDIKSFLNNGNLESKTIKTIEVSADGEIIFLLDYEFVYFYSFPNRKIISKMQYLSPFPLGEGVFLDDFYCRTTHCDYLL